jgi:hypothetical protein
MGALPPNPHINFSKKVMGWVWEGGMPLPSGVWGNAPTIWVVYNWNNYILKLFRPQIGLLLNLITKKKGRHIASLFL